MYYTDSVIYNHKLCIIVAFDKYQGIGLNNTIPWYLPEDLIHFKYITLNNTIIMGRRTFNSIGKILPNRKNVILTRKFKWKNIGVQTASSLEEAVAFNTHSKKIFFIGGAQIYTIALPLVTCLIVTEINQCFFCDTFFPAINPLIWKETLRVKLYTKKRKMHYDFVIYEKYSEKFYIN